MSEATASRASLLLGAGLVAFIGGVAGAVLGGSRERPDLSSGGSAAGPLATFAEVASRVMPAIVHVSVSDLSVPLDAAREPDAPQRGEGTGFLVDEKGYVVTSRHLVPGPGAILVRLSDKRELDASFVGADQATDLALLKIEAPSLKALSFGDSDRLRVGDWVCAIGNPYRFDHSLTVGVVSSKGRKLFDATFDSYLQTDAAINPGNSGGPLLDLDGRVVGVSAAVATRAQGLGFAVPSNVVSRVISELRTSGRVSRGFLGVQFGDLDPDFARLLGLTTLRGAVVVTLVPGQAGEQAGLRRYDVIVSVDGEPVEDGDALVRAVSNRKPGTRVELGVVREGQSLTLSAALQERSSPVALEREAPLPAPSPADALGVEIGELNAEARRGLPPEDRGVVVTRVSASGPAAAVLEPGDLILELNLQKVRDRASWDLLLSELQPGQAAFLYVRRSSDERHFLARLRAARPRHER